MERRVIEWKERIRDSRNYKKFIRKARIFKRGFVQGLSQDEAPMIIGLVTLTQGLKYKGSLVRGLEGGVATILVFGTVGGIASLRKESHNS